MRDSLDRSTCLEDAVVCATLLFRVLSAQSLLALSYLGLFSFFQGLPRPRLVALLPSFFHPIRAVSRSVLLQYDVLTTRTVRSPYFCFFFMPYFYN